MSLRELTNRLITTLTRQAKHLNALVDALENSRTAYIQVHPSDLETATAGLVIKGQKCTAVEESRQAILENIREQVGLDFQLSSKELLAHTPKDLKHRLEKANEATRKAARRLHVENRVGENILEFARDTQETMSRELLKLENAPNNNYGRNAKKIETASRTGRLISGTV